MAYYFFSGINMVANVNGSSCDYVATIGGGCPDVKACLEKCRPCYRGVGIVQPYCYPPDAISPAWECRCGFKKGAPFPPPGLWSPSSANDNTAIDHQNSITS